MRDLVIVKGKGALVWDQNGDEYIDCIASNGVVNVGHSNEQVADAISAQARTIMSVPGGIFSDRRAELLSTLAEITPEGLQRSFLCNSGAEAVEGALKFARISTGRSGVVAAMRAFHGRTLGALSATFNPKYRKGFEPLVPEFQHVPYNNLEKLDGALSESTAALLLEVIQGEGGVNPGQQEFLDGARNLCEQRGIVFIVDEVQSGFCRTGRMFACEHFDLKPDILCLAKAMGGGVPVGAVVCSDKIEVGFGKHGSTFGGNPLACAASLATVRYMQENDLAAAAARKGEYFKNSLQALELPAVREVRGLGLMVGVELKEKAKPYIEKLMGQGVLALSAGPTVVRFLPPLVITDEQLDRVVLAVKNAFT